MALPSLVDVNIPNEKHFTVLGDVHGQVGDASPTFDIMAGMLENISSEITVIAKTTVAAFYRTSQIIASLPIEAFPEVQVHQLLPAMVHPDHETRDGAHRIFFVVLVLSSIFRRSSPGIPPTVSDPNKAAVPRSL